MSRPKKIVTPENGTPVVKREKRPDPLPFKVYFKHFAANLSLGCVRDATEVKKVFLVDSATHNYSDVSELAELSAVAKKIFKGKASSEFIIAAFKAVSDATAFMDNYLNVLTVEMDTNDVIPADDTFINAEPIEATA